MKTIHQDACTPATVEEKKQRDEGLRLPDSAETVTLEEYNAGKRPWDTTAEHLKAQAFIEAMRQGIEG